MHDQDVVLEKIESIDRRLTSIESKIDKNTADMIAATHDADKRLASLEQTEESRQYWSRTLIGGVAIAVLTSIGGSILALVAIARGI
jgi:hypothetical protein